MRLELTGISKSFGKLELFSGFACAFEEGSVTVLLGPSGCGKTSLLRMIAGLLSPDSGIISGVNLDKLSFVFQEPRLAPWLSVEENVALAARDVLPRREALDRARRFIELVDLRDSAKAKPRSLSGGMRQRVSLARAFCRPAELLLMDEPFQSLDLGLRLSLMDEFTALWREEPKTALFVTHDIHEALYLGDEIVVLGGSPLGVVDRFPVHPERGSRDLSDMTELEKRLYRSLLGK